MKGGDKILSPFAIALLYVASASLWIIYSDKVLLFFFQNIEDIVFFQTAKGLLFVGISGLMIYLLTKKYERRTRIELKYTSKILQHSPLAIASIDKNAIITYINKVGTELLGIDKADTTEKTFRDLPYKTLRLDGSELKPDEFFYSRIMNGESLILNERYMLRLANGTEKFVSASAAPVRDTEGEIESVLLIVADKTEKIRAENALRAHEQRYRLLVESSPFGIAIHQKGKLVFVNPSACEMMEAENKEQLLGKNIRDLIHSSHLPILEERRKSILNGEKVEYPVEEKLTTLKGNTLDIEVVASVFQINGEKAIQVIATDISQRIKRENMLKKTLSEKEIVISEMHHRVKNNMAVISGLIQMQAMGSKDKKVNEVLYDAVRRIQSIALVHEELYHAKDLQNIMFNEHIEEMIGKIKRDFSNVDVRVHLEMDEIAINVNQAVPCALFVNEAITNVYRHAFDSGEQGELWVHFKQSGDQVYLIFHDSGKGFSEESLEPGRLSCGINLMQITAEQLHGELEIKTDGGAKVFLKFNRKTKAKGSAANLN